MKAKEKIMIGINVIVLIFVTIALMFSTSMGETISFLNVGKQLAGGEELSFNLIASPEEARVKAGDTVTITLSVADISMGKTGLNSIVGNLEYDEDLFDEMTIEGNKNGEGQADWQIELNQIENHALYGKFCIYAIEEGVTENQDVVTMTLKLKSDLKPQTTEVKFLDLQSSDGNVAVDEQERIVKIIIYDEEPRPEQPEVLPEEPEKVPEGTVQTGDQVIVIAIIVIAVTILANILVFVKNKKAKTISIIVVILLGLLSTCITVFAKNIDQDIMDKISKNESWLNSEKYLVTDVDISRIAPNSKIEQIKNNFNKEIKIYESTKDEQNVENLSEKTTGTVTTGMLIKTDDEENNYYVSVVGDLDRDGESNQVELTSIIRNTINSAKWGFTGIQAKSADMKLDGEIDEKDITASVRYIVYGELEIPGFEQVKAPILEIVEGTFNEHIDAYEDTIKIKVTEQEENAEKTVYKIVGTTDTEYTEITSGDVVTLEENGTYKILAYTYGKLGNRSEISTIIVNKDKATADYTIEYYKDDILMDTYEAEARIASTIETYPDKTPDGYRLGNVENKPLTITSDARANVMKVYYVKDNFDYSIEYYYDGQIDSTKTAIGNAEFATVILASDLTTKIEINKIAGYELDLSQGTNGIDGTPLTIGSNENENVIKVYYKATTYNLTYVLNDGTLETENPSTYNVTTPTFTLNNPTRSGYKFTGWTLTKLNGQDQTAETPNTTLTIEKGTTGDREYTANWELSTGKVIVHHYEQGTTTPVAQDEEIVSIVGQTYTVTNLISDTNKIFVGTEEKEETREYLDPNKYEYVTVERNEENTTIGTTEEEIANGTVSGTLQAEVQEITYYYNVNKYTITGEVVGGNGTISDITETVEYGNSSTKEIRFTPNNGYRVEKIMLYTGEEVDGTYGIEEDGGIEVTDYSEDSRTQIVTMSVFTNVTENKHIVVTFEERPIVAQIVAVPEGSENLTSGDGEPILNHTYYTLEDALNDAALANANPGQVEIKILADIRDESVIIEDGNNVVIDLNGFTINSNDEDAPTITVMESTLVVKDESKFETGKIISRDGIGIYITPNGECTLGIDNDTVSASTPTVEGAIYGIYKEVDGEQEGILKYYDGKVIGGTTAFAGSTKIDDRPLLYDPSIVTEDGKQVAVLAIVSNVEAVIGKTRYIELEDAFAAVEANPEYNLSTPVEIDVVDEVTIEAAIQVSMYKNIVLDLNGHAVSGIQANNVMQNAGKLEIKDSTAQVDEDEKYLELVQNGTYYFEKVGDHLEANNYGVDSSVANSYIEINLEQELPENEFELKINANISSDSGDNGFIEVTNTQDAPVVSSTNKLIYVSGLGQPKDYTKTLIGGQKYYVHFGYSKNASKSMGVDTLMVNSITLNGQDVLAELKQPKGVIELSAAANTIYNKPSGELVVNNAQITNKNTSTNYATIYNDGNLQTNDAKILTQGARTLYNLGIAELNGGLNIGNINNQTSGTLTINGDIRAYVTNTETITNTGNLIINNGIITSYSTSSICVSNTTNAKSLEINNGKFVGGKGLENYSPVVTINNGTFINNVYCIENSPQNGTVTINNAKMRSNSTAMYNGYNSTLYIKDCTIEAVSAIRNYSGNTKNNPIVIIDNATMVTSGETLENSGTITINGGSFTSTSDYVINNCYDYGYTIVNINGGTFESKTTYALYNSVSIGTFNIGTKNTEENKQISETNPTIKSAKSGVYSLIGIVNMYDGQIIAPVGQTIHGGFKEIETTDLDGNKLNINISQITENEVQYDRLTLQPIQEPVAKILKTSEGLNLIDLVENEDYTQDDEYYYFYNLNDAVSACSEIAEDNVTKIEILKNIITQKNITILEGQNIEIALNGKQINAYVGKEFINNNGTLKITNGVSEEQKGKITNMNTVIINNGKLDTEVDIKNNDIYSAVIYYGSNLPNNYEPYKTTITNNGQLTVNGGIIETEGTGVAIRNKNELIINDGIINALKVENNKGSYCISNKGNATCTINGGTLYCNGGSYNPVMCIRNLDNATIKMNGGSIIGAAPAIYNQSSRLSEDGINEPAVYITGGTINVGSNYCAIQSTLQSEVWIKQAENSEVLMQSKIDMQGKLIIDGGTFQKEVTNTNAIKISIKNAIMNERLTIAYSNSEILENEYEIVNSEIKSIFINSNGGLKIIDSKIGMSGTSDLAVISNDNTTITIENSSIYFNRSSYSAITNDAGTIIIPSIGETTIESVSSTCIKSTNAGTIIIGTKGGTVSQEYPKITGGDYGVYNVNGTLDFYDGMIIGKTSRSIYGNVRELEPGYNVVKTPNANNTTETAILEQVATVKIEKTSIDENNLVDNYATITDEDGTEYYGFYSIEDAALSCTDNVKTTIICMSEATYTQTSDAQVIPENKDIVLDLAGYKLNIAKDEAITNNGKLEIIDSSTSKTGMISATADMPIVNNGELTIIETTIQNTKEGTSENYAVSIQNIGTLQVNNSTLCSTGSYSICINNIGNVEIEGGTLDGKQDDTTIYAINNAGTGTVECNLTKFNNTWIGNKEQGTMEFIDVDMSTRVGIINYGTSVYEENVSKPAIRIKGGEICTSSYIRNDMIHYGLKNYAGEMILEDNQETSVDLHIYNKHAFSIRYTDIINEGGLITVNSGAIEQNFVNNSGTIQIKGGTIEGNITNKENAIFNIYGGTFTDKKNSRYCNVTNNGIMNIGKDDGTIEVNSPMFDYTKDGSEIISYGELNYYDGTICIPNNMPINEAINEIPENSTIIYTKEDTINKYTLSDTMVIATIDDEPYYTLQSAIDACTQEENKVIKLETSIALIEGQELNLEDKNITIDLNNNTIIGNTKNTLITTAGKLEIVDNSESKNGQIYSYGGKLIYNSGELKIANGTFEAVGYKKDITTIENVGTGTIDISGGTFNANPVTSQENKCIILLSTSTGDIQISGGTFNFNIGSQYRVYRAIEINNENTEVKPKLTITGDTTINTVQYVRPLEINNVDLEISGGTINAVSNSNIQNSTALITGGTVIGELSFSNSTLNVKDTPILDKVTVSTNSIARIESGTFNGRFTNSSNTEIVGGEFYSGITNNGTMTIKNALINTEGYNNAITTGRNSKLDLLENITIESNYTRTIYAQYGIINIYENITINNTYSSTTEAAGIEISSATVNIPNNVTIKTNNGRGIYMNGGTLNLGEKDYPVSKELPSITGSTYGIYKESGTFNFYDGILKGGTQALYGTVSDKPELYSVTYSDETQTTAYLSIIPTVERVAKVGDLYYNTIEGAIEAIVNSGGTGRIDIAKDIVLNKTVVIPSGNNITLDLQAHTISYASNTDATIQIEPGATLTIIDSIEDGTSVITYGAVQNLGGIAIKNNGTLNIGDNTDGTMYRNSPRIIGVEYAVENSEDAVFNFYDGILKGITGVYNSIVEPTIPEGYSLQEGTEVINETLTYITKYLVIQ